ncbi:hypothetical protein MJ1_0185 [Nanobdella aerobiophila]|uniref:Uncharacterized protein n=1 Tax=Nanobdella aerobiophila TaxID=2586965 RepID=A0A915SCG0_9ARCH|nr:hypothetical protein [Nanobdella aerobiophila]BBL45358.1 hypothetical protein MJ1_0185 [Nanobdella aerobiophila]
MEEKIKNIDKDFLKDIRCKLASTSTGTLIKYYEDIKSNVIPQNLSSYTEYINTFDLLEFIEKELIARGALRKIKRINLL